MHIDSQCAVPHTLPTAQAKALGVPKGPMYGRLKAGETVTLPNGDVVHPSDVLGPPTPGPMVLLLDCPSNAHLATMQQRNWAAIMGVCRRCSGFAGVVRMYSHKTLG